MTINGRKSHVKRCLGVTKNSSGGSDENSSIYLDILRTDEFDYITSDGQGYRFILKWSDDVLKEDADGYDAAAGIKGRVTSLGKGTDPELPFDSDPSDFVPYRIIDKLTIVDSDGQGFKYVFKNQNATSEGVPIDTARKIDVVRLYHSDTVVDDRLDDTAGTHIVTDEQYSLELDTQDKTQYIDAEVIKNYIHTVQAGAQAFKVVFHNAAIYDALLSASIQSLLSLGTNSSGDPVIPVRLDPFQNVLNAKWGTYDNRVVFAIDNDGSDGEDRPAVYASKNGWDWQRIGPLLYTGDRHVTFINIGGFRRDTKQFVVSGVTGFFNGSTFETTDIVMASDDGITWSSAGTTIDSALLYAYSKKATSRSANGYVWRVADGSVVNTERAWDKVDDKRYQHPLYARVGGSVIQRCTNTAAKEDDDTQSWETVLSAGGAYTNFGPITVVKGTGPGDVPTVTCVASSSSDDNKFAIIASRDGHTFTERFTGPTIAFGGSDLVSFYSGYVEAEA